jgi:hypothetical protein
MSGLLLLQGCHIFLEEVFDFFVGEHLVDQLEYGLPVLFFELLDKPELFDGGFVLDDDFRGDIPVGCEYLVGGHVEELCGFVEFIHGDYPGSFFNFVVCRLVHAYMGGDIDLFESFLFPDCPAWRYGEDLYSLQLRRPARTFTDFQDIPGSSGYTAYLQLQRGRTARVHPPQNRCAGPRDVGILYLQ